jgi:glycosyltransferase involved in cell wall biosynthesis
LGGLNDAVHRRLLARAHAVVAPTPAIAEDLARRYGVRAEVVPTGLSPEYLAEARAAARSRQPGSAPRVLYLGRLAPEKNLDVLLRAFALLLRGAPDATLVMAGVGPDAARLRDLAASLGFASRVVWLGFVPEAELARVYASADAFVSPSTYETQGLTVLEAMAAGAPVACPDMDVFRELTKAGAVEPFAPDDAESAARAIARCLEARPARAAAGQRIVERSTADASAARLLRIYGP